MGEIITWNMLSWLKLSIKLLLLHLVSCLYCCINDARSHKHQMTKLIISYCNFGNAHKNEKLWLCVTCGCKTRSLTWNDEHGLGQRTLCWDQYDVVGPGKERVRGWRAKLPNENFLTLPFTECCWLGRDKEGELVGRRNVRGGRGETCS